MTDSPDTLEQRLRELCERHKDVTPGPWHVEVSDGYMTGHITSPLHTYAGNLSSRTDSICDENSMTNADANAIADLPTMLAALREAADALSRLRAERDAARMDAARLEFLNNHCDGVDVLGGGSADDTWWKVIHHDGNVSEGATLRSTIDSAINSAKG